MCVAEPLRPRRVIRQAAMIARRVELREPQRHAPRPGVIMLIVHPRYVSVGENVVAGAWKIQVQCHGLPDLQRLIQFNPDS